MTCFTREVGHAVPGHHIDILLHDLAQLEGHDNQTSIFIEECWGIVHVSELKDTQPSTLIMYLSYLLHPTAGAQSHGLMPYRTFTP